MLLSEIRGQETAVEILSGAIRAGRLPNAYLFTGPAGVGKRRAALALAKARLCARAPSRGCHSCGICRRIDEGTHPDVRLLLPRDEGSRNIPVQVLREEILKLAQFAPFEGPHSFLIFDDADVSLPMEHPEAANVLLKPLEEPQEGLTFILLSPRPLRLMTTIRSRCQRVRFGLLPDDVLRQVLASHETPESQREAATLLAEGSAGRALELVEQGVAQGLIERALQVDQLVNQGQADRLISLAEELAKASDLRELIETLMKLYSDQSKLALGFSPSQVRFASVLSDPVSSLAALAPELLAERVLKLGALFDLLAQNANPEIALDHLLLSLRG